MAFIPRPQEIYKHFKGNLYQIVAVAEHSETGEQLVVYQALYGDFRIYARPLEMFSGRVDRKKYPDAEQEFRFELWKPEPEAGEQLPPKERADAERGEPETGGQLSPKERTDAGKGEPETGEQLPPKERTDAGRGEPARAEVPAQAAEPGEQEPEELPLDPMVLEFLDADSYEQKLNILAGLRHRITDDMITTMAIACDIEVGEGDTQSRYESLRSCLLTMERYECNRIR